MAYNFGVRSRVLRPYDLMGYAIPTTLLATLLVALPAAAQRRGVTQLTSLQETHQLAKISPNGQTVAFAGPSKIGAVAFGGGAEVTLVNGINLGDFVWSPTSAGLYFLDNAVLKFVPRFGGAPTSLTTLPGQQHRLWAVDAADRKIWGTRLDSTTQTYHIFTVPTNGGAQPTDIVSSVLVMDEVKLDPQDQFILYRAFSPGIPFSPVEYFRADADGQNAVSITGGSVTNLPELADWVDNGQSIVFTMISAASARRHLGRIGPTGTQIRMLSEGSFQRRFSAVSPDRRWVVHHATYGDGSSAAPAVIPADGGGLVLLATDGLFYQFEGPPTADDGGTRIAFAARVFGSPEPAHVFAVELERELYITPRAEVGQSFTVTLPVTSSESGTAFLSIGISPLPFSLFGFEHSLDLDPTLLLPILAGTTSTGSLTSVPIRLPNNPALIGASIYFQGLRVRSSVSGDFTRYAEVRIF